MKKLIFAFSAFLALANVSSAQNATAPAPAKGEATEMKDKKHDKHGKGEHGKGMGKHDEAKNDQGKKGGKGLSDLGLSPEQETKFKALNEAHKAAMKKLDMDATVKGDAKKTQKDALKSKYEADVKGVMNADQYTKWLEKRNNHKDHKEMGDKKGKGDKGGKKGGKADSMEKGDHGKMN
jgi:hypothetical protein